MKGFSNGGWYLKQVKGCFNTTGFSVIGLHACPFPLAADAAVGLFDEARR